MELMWDAFNDSLMGLMYPKGFTEAAKAHNVEHLIKEWRRHPDLNKYMKVIDAELPENDPMGKIVGVSHWKFYLHQRSNEELDAEKKEKADEPFPPDVNEELLKEFFGEIGKHKREIMGGKPYVLLSLLATRKAYHRRGIGAMHLRWGLEQADQLNLPSYLEASPMGKPLYLRMGYEELRPLPFDAKKWGATEDLPHSILLRPAPVLNGEAK